MMTMMQKGLFLYNHKTHFLITLSSLLPNFTDQYPPKHPMLTNSGTHYNGTLMDQSAKTSIHNCQTQLPNNHSSQYIENASAYGII